ncbi:hypothetical protein GHT09_019370 [Marmota monax]|uniref:Uncharacterized protein n=1 Tax=Marmota monax TaxID=9995 RepID=A0A834UIL5_MARMO|nr:hypothetical protein GHT09_019370 [Marmota monax]
MLGPTRSPNICWLKSEALHIMYYMAAFRKGHWARPHENWIEVQELEGHSGYGSGTGLSRCPLSGRHLLALLTGLTTKTTITKTLGRRRRRRNKKRRTQEEKVEEERERICMGNQDAYVLILLKSI